MDSLSPTLLWACLGIVLVIVEMFTSTFFLLFFGVAALVVALVKAVGLSHLGVELMLFAGLGLGGTLVFRKKLVQSLGGGGDQGLKVLQTITLSCDVPAGSNADIQYRGATWTAYNQTEQDLKKDQVVSIDRIEGIRLYIKENTKISTEE